MKKIVTGIALLILAVSAHANLILVDFGGVSTSNPDTNGNNWNNITVLAGTVASLTDTTGTGTGFSLTWSGFTGNNSGTIVPTLALGNLAIQTATSDNIYTGSGITGTVTLSNLDPTKVYNFTFFGARDATSDRFTQYTVTGSNSGVSALQTSGTNIGSDGIKDYNDNQVALVSSILANGSNQIVINVTATTATFGYLSAIQIDVTNAVPEPATVGMIGVGALVALLVRRFQA